MSTVARAAYPLDTGDAVRPPVNVRLPVTVDVRRGWAHRRLSLPWKECSRRLRTACYSGGPTWVTVAVIGTTSTRPATTTRIEER